MVIAAAEGRLLALTMVALHPPLAWHWKGPSEVLLSGVEMIIPTCHASCYETYNTFKEK